MKQNKTTYVTSEDYDQNPSNTEWFIFWDEMTDWCLPNRHLRGSVDPKSIGEYTGLHDKNGREIYEGDVLDIGLRNQDGKPVIAPVSYETYAAGYVLDNGGNGIWQRLTEDCEVIGNIFENPELLEGKQ